MTKSAAYLVGVMLFCLACLYNFNFLPKPQWNIKTAQTLVPPTPLTASSNRIQIALILDTSSSMDGLIEQAKSQLWKMVNELADTQKDGQSPDVEIALYEYGNSQLNARAGYIRSVVPMTTDMDQISEDLFRLTTNGGEEYCGWVIKDALSQLQWSNHPDDLKIIVIAGNESFDQGPINFRKICKSAKRQQIIVNAVHCGDYRDGLDLFWGEAAQLTGGQYMNINQDDQVVHIATPYDNDIVKLNTQLNQTYVAYGQKGKINAAKQATQDTHANTYGLSNARERASFKAKKAYKNTTWDLVDATEESSTIVEELEADELPSEMQSMSTSERKDYIQQKRQERESIKKQITELNKKAESYIADQRKEQAQKQTLDVVLIQHVSKQAEAKGFIKK